MLVDLVVDTNILLHAGNPNEPRFEHAKSLVETLMRLEIVLCVDEGFSFERSRNRSQIGNEYLEHLSFGTVGFEVIRALASSDRIKLVSRVVNRKESKLITQKVWDPTDRIFVRVAINSDERVLVSHDFGHFPLPVRNLLRGQIEVRICDCAECLNLCAP